MFYNVHKKKGQLKTSIACDFWELNRKALPYEVKKVRVHLSKLEDYHLSLLRSFLLKEKIENSFSYKQSCGDCRSFTTCKHSPKNNDIAKKFNCSKFNFDIVKKTGSPKCPKELKAIFSLLKFIRQKDYIYILNFLDKFQLVRQTKKLNFFLGETIAYEDHNVIIVDVTDEHIIAMNKKVTIYLLFDTLRRIKKVKKQLT